MPASRGLPKRPRTEQSQRLDKLLVATADGDRASFTELYSLTVGKLLSIAVRMVGRRELAEEVLQDSFLAIWQKAGQYRPGVGSPLGWLATIVRHRAIDRLRSIGSTPEIAVGSDADLDLVANSQSQSTESRIVAEQSINHCLEHLKERQRRLILLAFYYGLTHEELATRVGAPLGTVKSEVRRGLKTLRSCLEQ